MASSDLLPKDLETTFPGPGVSPGGSLHGRFDKEAKDASVTDAGLRCTSFDWLSSWKMSMASASHGGRASLAYLQQHPDEDSEVHVVFG